MGLRYEIIQLGRELDEERNAAFDLWTWLPSHQEAVKHHGDYASEHTPGIAQILREASVFIPHGLHPTQENRAEVGDLYECPCGTDHSEPTTD